MTDTYQPHGPWRLFGARRYRRLTHIVVAGCIAFSLGAGLCTPAHAIKITTSEFVVMCGGEIETVAQDINRVICLSYLQGVLDTHGAMITLFPPAVLYCAPSPGPEVEQARQVFLAWAAENDDYLGRPADITIISALNAAFPCAN